KQSDLPSGYDHLCQFVMSGQLSDSEKLLESLENFWNGIQEWTLSNQIFLQVMTICASS
ncbi:hypothetical protein D9R19_12440, partial [Corynebacterium diphtheriae]